MITVCGRLRRMRTIVNSMEEFPQREKIIEEINESMRSAKKMSYTLMIYKETLCEDCERKADKLKQKKIELENWFEGE